MTRKLKALAGGMAVAALATAGAVAANAAGSSTVEKVGYFEVQGDENPSPAGWFSEGDDGIADISFNLDSVIFADGPKAVGLNKAVDVPFDPEVAMGIDSTGDVYYSIVLTSSEASYLRLTATDETLATWVGTGYHDYDPDTPRIGFPGGKLTQSLADWAAEDFLAESAKISLIGARHHSGEGPGAVSALTFGGTTYDFGLVEDVTPFSQAELDEALATVPSGYVAKSLLDAEAAKVAKLEKDLAAAEKALAAAEKAAQKAADKAKNVELKAAAQKPWTIQGTVKVGKTLKAKGKAPKGMSVKYAWKLDGKKVSSKSSYKLPKSAKGKKVSLEVTTSYKNAFGQSKKVTVKAVLGTSAKVAK